MSQPDVQAEVQANVQNNVQEQETRPTPTLLQFWRRWRVPIIGLLVSVAAIWVIRGQVNLDELGQAFARARYVYLLPTVLLVVIGLWVRAWRWRALLNDAILIGRAFPILNVAYFVNGVLPLRAGEVVRAYLATRVQPPIPVLTSASSIIIERLLDLLAVLVILLLALTAAPLPGELRAAALFFAPLTILGFLLLIVLSWQRAFTLRVLDIIIERVARRAPALGRLNLPRLAGQFLDGLLPLTRPALAARALALTAISWAFSLATGYVLMLAFYDSANWGAVCLFTAAASFAVAVPAVPGNVGPYEASILLALGAFGLTENFETALAFAVMVHAVNLGVNVALGLLGFVQEGMTFGALQQGMRGMNRATAGQGSS